MTKTAAKRFLTFRTKLFLSTNLLVLIPVIIIGYFSYTFILQSMEEKTESSLQFALQQINNNISYQLKDLERSSEQVVTDQILSKTLANYKPEWEKYYLLKQYIQPKFESAITMPNQDVHMKVYIHNDRINEIYYNYQGRDPLSWGRRYELLRLSRLEDMDWYHRLTKGELGEGWLQVEDDAKFGNISLIRQLIDYETFRPIGLVRLTAKLSEVLSSVSTEKLGQGGYLTVLSGEQPVYSGTEESSDTDYHRIESIIEPLNYKLVAFIPNSELTKDAKRIRKLTIIVGVMSFIILSGFSSAISSYFSRRIRKIVHSLYVFREGAFHKRIHLGTQDEFGQIATAFNDMASTIEQLIHEVYENKLQKKSAELQLLQAQINPHFLYNTLSSISRMAKLGEVETLHETVRELARFYRLSLHEGDFIIPISSEVQQIQSYVQIQKIKFGEQFQVLYDIDQTIESFYTVKMIFQPFVENVLEHAWFGGTITVRIIGERRDDVILFQIIDDGAGMSKNTLEQLLQKNGQKIGYGIHNVDERIKLQFGSEYGVSIDSVLGGGTTVMIRIPIYIP